ncbi:MAG: pseudouridine synthase [Spirochaetes bacterium]|jgi:23S rRNA pseudouridine955/2504/2580 synthase|nr:pseudouridine synthase [Spirochaetota bacterium]
MRLLESRVENLVEEERLDLYLSRRFDYLSRNQWQKSVSAGKLTVNGKTINRPSYKIKNGDCLVFSGANRVEPAVDTAISVIYSDESVIVINKTGDLPVHPAGRYFENSALRILEKSYGCKLFPLNRIDRETSGVVLFARTQADASRISQRWSCFGKRYLVLVRGEFPPAITCSIPIGPAYLPEQLTDSVVHKKRKAFIEAKESAVTRFTQIFYGNGYSLVSAELETGRQHQIRVHLEYLEFPVVGDKIYGGDEGCYLEFIRNGMSSQLAERAGHNRTLLHAYTVSFNIEKEPLIFRAPLPEDFVDRAKLLAGFDCTDFS